ncbi:DUF485 domain-containing protein [Streptomyces thermolilacinus]|uniref:DUF485 domain-containing protein n=1 Tax=Streptomyces thermolilacinus TaxID=285540 RepID=UPI0003C77732|nr:DUF485 domain-containing protein [Streptomyces thermolilacinus]
MDNWEGRDAAATRRGDPWYDALASGWGEPADETAPDGTEAATADGQAAVAAAHTAVGAAQGAAVTVTPPPAGAAIAAAAGHGTVPGTAVPRPSRTGADGELRPSAAEIYLEVRRSPAFQEVRRRYRRFVGPATVLFLTWYLGYVVAATTAPGLMARPVVGAVNVAMLACLGQFLTTFVLTWAYARHARVHRDRAALELRWDTQQMTREAGVDR